MKVDFYQLSQPIERVLPRIAERVIADGGRLLVVAEDETARAAIDRALWAYDAESFLPHAQAGQGDDTGQPALISATTDAVNGARNIALADGQWREAALAFDRAFYFFDDATIDGARASWRTLSKAEGVEARFWRQEDGKWRQGP